MITSILGSILLLIAAIMSTLILFGLPLGEFVMGGKYKILPNKMRIACALSIVIQLFAILIVLQTAKVIPTLFPYHITRGICIFFAAYFILNTIMNFFSNSRKEKMFATPLSLVTSVCFWITALV